MLFRPTLAVLAAGTCVFGIAACGGDDDAATTVTEPSPPTGPATTGPATTGPATTVTEPSPTAEPVATTEPPPATEPPTTVPPRANALELGFVSCDRFGIGSRVNPEIARTYVPDSYELWLAEDNALFSLQTMSCDDLMTDGMSHGPGHFGTVWIRIVGPEQAVSLPPDSDLVAQPTDTFYPPLFHTDNESFHAASTAFGIPMTLAESMTSDPPMEGTQTGAVIDLDYSPPFSYRWNVDNVNRNDEVGRVGLHNMLGLDTQGAPLTYYGEFLHEPGWWGNMGTLELEPGSAVDDLIGTSLTGPVNGDPITIDMVAFRDAT